MPPQITRVDAKLGEWEMQEKTAVAVGRIAEPQRTMTRDEDGEREVRESGCSNARKEDMVFMDFDISAILGRWVFVAATKYDQVENSRNLNHILQNGQVSS